MVRRFRLWLARLIQRSAEQLPAEDAGLVDDRIRMELEHERQLRLTAESDLQQLRLDLGHAQQRVAQLQADLTRQGREQGEVLSERLAAQLEELLTPLATPLAQLLTQQHLIENQGKELSAKDVLSTGLRIWQGLRSVGLEAVESIGSVVTFDPNRHQPLTHATSLTCGKTVRVRIPGIALRGRILKVAAVDTISEGTHESA